MDLNEHYYVLFEDTSLKMVGIDGDIEPDFPPYMPAPIHHTVEVYITMGKKKNPRFYDIHFAAGCLPIVTEPVYKELEKLNLYKVQLLKGTHGEIIEEFDLMMYKIWCYNRIQCLDMEKSKYGSKESDNSRVYDLERIFLDNERLAQVPEEERQIFYIAERPTCLIVHQNVVDALEPHKFQGASFTPVNKWSLDSIFDD